MGAPEPGVRIVPRMSSLARRSTHAQPYGRSNPRLLLISRYRTSAGNGFGREGGREARADRRARRQVRTASSAAARASSGRAPRSASRSIRRRTGGSPAATFASAAESRTCSGLFGNSRSVQESASRAKPARRSLRRDPRRAPGRRRLLRAMRKGLSIGSTARSAWRFSSPLKPRAPFGASRSLFLGNLLQRARGPGRPPTRRPRRGHDPIERRRLDLVERVVGRVVIVEVPRRVLRGGRNSGTPAACSGPMSAPPPASALSAPAPSGSRIARSPPGAPRRRALPSSPVRTGRRCRCRPRSPRRVSGAPQRARERRLCRPARPFSSLAKSTTRTVRRGLTGSCPISRAASMTIPQPAPSSIAPLPRSQESRWRPRSTISSGLLPAGDLADHVRRLGRRQVAGSRA